MHPTIKFTADWPKTSINFLDVTVSITEEIIEADLYMLNLRTVNNIFCRLTVILFIAKRTYHTARH